MSYTKSFIETQFPVSKISKESYKERMANNGQTLTGLGKWWGRKPLILVRATILGLLMPASNDPKKDREIFLKILSMDDDGLWLRKEKDLSILQYYKLASDYEKEHFFEIEENFEGSIKIKWNSSLLPQEKNNLQKKIFSHLSYDERLTYCIRPEHLQNLPIEDWAIINDHLKTDANSLKDLVDQLGKKQFGHTPKVGDAFCGGGSIPFEAARMGCEAFGSDLSPVAALLTWSALNIIGGGEDIIIEVKKAQHVVYDAVDKQITEWGIEHNEKGWRADAYLYCVEARCSVSGYMIPLSPSWVIGEKSKAVAKLVQNDVTKSFDIIVESGVSEEEMLNAKRSGTVKGGYIINPVTGDKTSIQILRGDRLINGESVFGLRKWENNDLVSREEDVFQERLYCIRYVETFYEKQIVKDKKKVWIELTNSEVEAITDYELLMEQSLRKKSRKHYVSVTPADLKRENKVLTLLQERFKEWQEKGYIPSRKIDRGYNTDQPIRERGWTFWHHLFNPRQLLIHGMFNKYLRIKDYPVGVKSCLLLGIGKLANWNSRLTFWDISAASEKGSQTFSNQALNTLFNYSTRGSLSIEPTWFYNISQYPVVNSSVRTIDARILKDKNDYWVTDPPYADAINYHELGDYFLSWYEKAIKENFPQWDNDAKKSLAITGSGEDFRKGMVDAYTNLTKNMNDDGAQVVMFTHQNSSVWADLALILWASGLQVTTAWTIATETDAGSLKAGNYVQGTVCMVLRKQITEDETFISDVYPEIEQHVTEQLKAMIALEDKEDRNFSDSDYQLAAYAAALRVLTSYRKIHPIDVQYELTKPRKKGEKNEVEKLIDKAVVIATNYLVPEGLDKDLWITLRPEEKFYLKGLEVETHGEYRSGVYQEFARGFGVKEYKYMLSTGNANETRLRSALEFKNKNLRDEGFGISSIRQLLFAIHETHVQEDPKAGKQFLKDEVKEYWQNRQKLISITRYIQNLGSRISHWQNDAKAANLLAGALENDHL